ncbi:iron ABC transporter substrate-binding protein [Oceanisphaera profunda]|uniref:Iron ABC transporter substrate-binding protein n=1 Tax=Oceanisphaera profunda TaxID=1416627 RepID=A0A1Y0D495_9GAMM|nr:Fe(3+) ABC transporter substrate-binding protein [Oceanisphaera profunda]ART82016.1 iron ABC transporter substrate-binding protein [Oceanisphaera profunda]
MPTKLGLSAAALLVASFTGQAFAEEVNVYSNRQDFLVKPIIDTFTKETGIDVNVVFLKDGLGERLEREGRLSPADLLLTVDVSRLMDVVDKDLTQAVESEILEESIPAQYRDADGKWFAVTTRARAIYTSKDRIGKREDITYEELADPKYKGKVCTRSGKHPYNVALTASMIDEHGVDYTKTWLQGLKANLAQKPQGGDRDQIKAIKDGVCDYALGNSYYYGVMLSDEEQRETAEAVYINFPNQADRGTHVNISAVALAKHAKNKDAAIKLMEFLASDEAQHLYASANHEYPVKEGVEPSALVKGWGDFAADKRPLVDVAKHAKTAVQLVDEVKFDL